MTTSCFTIIACTYNLINIILTPFYLLLLTLKFLPYSFRFESEFQDFDVVFGNSNLFQYSLYCTLQYKNIPNHFLHELFEWRITHNFIQWGDKLELLIIWLILFHSCLREETKLVFCLGKFSWTTDILVVCIRFGWFKWWLIFQRWICRLFGATALPEYSIYWLRFLSYWSTYFHSEWLL